jgi:hypothetical protein
MRAVYFSGPRFDRPLTLPKLYLKIVERRSRVLDFGHRERPMLILFWPFDPGSNRDRVNVELPPPCASKLRSRQNEIERLRQVRQSPGMMLMSFFMSLGRLSADHRLFGRSPNPITPVITSIKIGSTMLEDSMSKHQADESLRKRLKRWLVRVRKIVRRHPGHFTSPASWPRSGSIQNLIFERHPFRIVFCEPFLGGVFVGEDLQVIGVADLLAGVDVENFHFAIL